MDPSQVYFGRQKSNIQKRDGGERMVKSLAQQLQEALDQQGQAGGRTHQEWSDLLGKGLTQLVGGEDILSFSKWRMHIGGYLLKYFLTPTTLTVNFQTLGHLHIEDVVADQVTYTTTGFNQISRFRHVCHDGVVGKEIFYDEKYFPYKSSHLQAVHSTERGSMAFIPEIWGKEYQVVAERYLQSSGYLGVAMYSGCKEDIRQQALLGLCNLFAEFASPSPDDFQRLREHFSMDPFPK